MTAKRRLRPLPRPQPSIVVERVYAAEPGAGGDAIAALLARHGWAPPAPAMDAKPRPVPVPDTRNGQRAR